MAHPSATLRSAGYFPSQFSLPKVINYEDPNAPIEKEGAWLSGFCLGPIQKIGGALRNAFYLPLYKKIIDPNLERDNRLAEKTCHVLMNPLLPCSKELDPIRQFFSFRDIPVHIQGATMTRTFTVRLAESKEPIQGKKLRMILFVFNGNTELEEGKEPRRWEPLTIEELSRYPLCVLKAIESCGVRVDSLVTTSLGNVALEGLKDKAAVEPNTIPPILIINRGLTSVKKVADQLYWCPRSCFLHSAAQCSGWDANPEQELLNFLKSEKNPPLEGRKIVVIETHDDFYFKEKGRFDRNMHEEMEQLCISVSRISLYPFPGFSLHSRAHHALPLSMLTCNSETQVDINAASLSFEEDLKMSSVLAKDIFLKSDQEWHTCYYIGGSDATLPTGTLREIVPLLSAFIEERV